MTLYKIDCTWHSFTWIYKNKEHAIKDARALIEKEAKSRRKLYAINTDDDGEGFWFFTTRATYRCRVTQVHLIED